MPLSRLRVVLALAVGACAGRALADPFRLLTDADLAAYAAAPFDPSPMLGKRIVLGLHHGLPVVAEFFCGDVCPAQTERIIHYEIGPGAPCATADGATVTRPVPHADGEVEAQFCVPKVLAK